MPRDISQTALRAMFAQTTREQMVECLTLEHDDWEDSLHIVNDNMPLQRTFNEEIVEFLPFRFHPRLLPDVDDRIPKIMLRVDNISQVLIQELRAVSTPVHATLEVVLRSQPNVIEAGPYRMLMRDFRYNEFMIEGELTFRVDLLGLQFPKGRFLPSNASE